jgi:hypothetical protein
MKWRTREPDPIEQIDYGIGYRGVLSPQSHSSARSEGGSTAMCIIALMLSTIAFTLVVATYVFMKDAIQSETSATEKRLNDKVNASETRAMDYAYLAKQEARIALEQGQKAEAIAKEKRK